MNGLLHNKLLYSIMLIQDLGGLLQFSDENYRIFQAGTFLATEGLY